MELKILRQSVNVSVSSKEDEEYYMKIAEKLNDELSEILKHLDIRSDTKAYVRLLFKLAVENDKLTRNSLKLDEESTLDRCISKLNI